MFIYGGPEYDVIIVGGGPAGMTAALYACRNGKSSLIIEKEKIGGQITSSPKVENFPGRMEMSGDEFAGNLLKQVQENGADLTIGTVINVKKQKEFFIVETEGGEYYTSYAVILANGVMHRTLGLDGEIELIGQGIHFCAVCDGNLYAGKKVVVVGGGNSALQEAIMLSDIVKKVTIVQNLEVLTGEKRLIEILAEKENVQILYSSVVDSYQMEQGKLIGLTVVNEIDKCKNFLACDGCFLAVGLLPDNQKFSPIATLDNRGYFEAGEDCSTHTAGVFCAGDCRRKRVRQLTTAVADGAIAALAACNYIDENSFKE